MMVSFSLIAVTILFLPFSLAFTFQRRVHVRSTLHVTSYSSCDARQLSLSMSSSKSNQEDGTYSSDLSSLLTARLPTSVDDQVRQAAESVKRATANGIHRHLIRLLLPIIGATELDDWPGGARQQMEAACPLVESILLQGSTTKTTTTVASRSGTTIMIQKRIIDESDGVAALMVQALSPKDDSCTILLPTAETVKQSVLDLDKQVGPSRNLNLVNPQYRRRSDFGGLFGNSKDKIADYVETTFAPTFSLTNLICEGESIRILRTYPGPWRVFVREQDPSTGAVDWKQVGSKDVLDKKPSDWEQQPANQRDGGMLFNYGQPSYQDIIAMLYSSPNFIPKSPAERAAAAFNFIKDTL